MKMSLSPLESLKYIDAVFTQNGSAHIWKGETATKKELQQLYLLEAFIPISEEKLTAEEKS